LTIMIRDFSKTARCRCNLVSSRHKAGTSGTAIGGSIRLLVLTRPFDVTMYLLLQDVRENSGSGTQ
jgi:hypothetical protein